MWYVIQTYSRNENEVKEYLHKNLHSGEYAECFIPLYEEVRRKGGECRILLRKMFPGYLFIDTDNPEKVFRTLKKMREFARVLGSDNEDGTKVFIPVSADDENFLKTLMDDGVMHVSFVEMSKNNRYINKVVGPLAKYKNFITRLEVRKREAVTEVDIFGKRRKIRFGLWTNTDPKLPWVEHQKETMDEIALDCGKVMDIGIYPGDRVKDMTGVYGEYVFVVDKVNLIQRTIRTKIDLFGGKREIELFADQVESV